MSMITRDFKKYLMRGKGSSRGKTFNKPRAPEKQTNEGCYKCGKTDHIIKNCPQWEIEWKKERAEGRNKKKELDSEDKAGDEQALMAIGESDDEQEVGKKKVDHTHITLEENLGKMKDELYKKYEQIRVLKENLGKVQVKGSSQIWYMDNGFPKHMIGSKNEFLSLRDLKGGNVSFGNEKKGEIIGVGKEYEDEAIGLVKELSEVTAQAEDAPK
ncbi:uncharacterized protein [Nicotiana sylvestris]|uniref:uncharacterized protein n=1 Tax=Nicotiana sylvestris TaxID=4096 RepID=UPI00388C865E